MLISDWSSDVCSSDLCFRGSLKPLLSFVSIHSSACPVLLFYPTAPNILHTKKSFTYACVCISLPERMQAANANGQSAIRHILGLRGCGGGDLQRQSLNSIH